MFLLVVTVAAIVQGQVAPTINADGESITVEATDLVLRQQGQDAISVSGDHATLAMLATKLAKLETEIAELRGNETSLSKAVDTKFVKYATEEFLESEISAATDSVKSEVIDAQKDAAKELNDRVDKVTEGIVGYPQTVKVVADLAEDVEYLLTHADNVTLCGSDGGVHVGDGECASPVPTCESPGVPDEGEMVLSSPYILPGTTAKYTCPNAGTFLQGPPLRTCTQGTSENKKNHFDGADPKCLTCEVGNCVLCVDEVDTCELCAEGHGVSPDRKKCIEEDITVFVFGKGHYDAQNEFLAPNAEKYSALTPDLHPRTPRDGAAALIQGTLYVVSSIIFRGQTEPYYLKLGKGDKEWSKIAAAPFKIKMPFYATVTGVGRKQDGFYISDTTGFAVYKPADDEWTSLPEISTTGSTARNKGATAVLGSKIFCIGGYAGGAVSDAMDVFDSTKGEWAQGPAMPAKRALHAAAAYNNKVYVFGGSADTPNGILSRTTGAEDSMLVFDIASSKWDTSYPTMPDTWLGMGNGPLPVFPGGKILIPESAFCNKICRTYSSPAGQETGSLQYNALDNSWEVIKSPSPYNRMSGGSQLVVYGAFKRY